MPFNTSIEATEIGKVYADALFGASEDANCTDAVAKEFDSVIMHAFEKEPRFADLLTSVMISIDERQRIIERAFAKKTSKTLLSFLKILSRNERFDCLPAVHDEFVSLCEKKANIIAVNVTTAVELPHRKLKHLTKELEPIIGGTPKVTTKVDPDLIGGIVIHVGDHVLDASVANQLKQLREQLIGRSRNEIQSRRDRFRYQAGD